MLRSCRFKMWIMYWQAFYWELWNWTAQYEYLNSLTGMNVYSIQNEIWQVERYIRCFSEVTKETIHTTNTQNGWSWCQWCKYSSLNIYHILHFPDFVFFFRCRSRYCQQWPLSTRVCVKSRQSSMIAPMFPQVNESFISWRLHHDQGSIASSRDTSSRDVLHWTNGRHIVTIFSTTMSRQL